MASSFNKNNLDKTIIQKHDFKFNAPENRQNNHYLDLFKYISRNRVIPTAVNQIKLNDKTIQKLLSAINRADTNDEFFSDPNCHLYVLWLLEKQIINYPLSMTVYAYLISLMQFTNKHFLKKEDNDLKFIRPIDVVNLVKNNICLNISCVLHVLQKLRWSLKDENVNH